MRRRLDAPDSAEPFGLSWPGKRAATARAAAPPDARLLPAPGEGVDEAATRNLLIEGDNLDALKLLQAAQAGQVKLIYIDPPYNTGNDFAYSDAFGGAAVHRHAQWLNMIYPRLLLARGVLREDGALFVSIDEIEVHHLRMALDEVFGAENFLGNIVWRSRASISNDQPISINHTHTLCYARDIGACRLRGEPLDHAGYKNPDGDPRGPWKLVPLDANKPGGDTRYPIRNPNTGVDYLPPNNRSWAINRSEFERLLGDGRIAFGLRGDSAPKRKLFLRERLAKGDSKTPSSLLLDAGTTRDGTREVMDLFGGMKVFQYAKPMALIARLCRYAAGPGDLVLDFFAGSGTTGHAIAALNAREAAGLSYILVQYPAPLDPAIPSQRLAHAFCREHGLPPNLAEIAKERLRRAMAALRAEGHGPQADLGFRVAKLIS